MCFPGSNHERMLLVQERNLSRAGIGSKRRANQIGKLLVAFVSGGWGCQAVAHGDATEILVHHGHGMG
jgi:hypothetical protein